MKSNELRIGNITEQGKIIELKQIICRVEYFTTHFRTSLIKYEDLKPIPLTEEILLKCGFIKSNIADEIKYFLPIPNLKCEIHATVFRREFVIELLNSVKPIVTEVTYLHQLQNLYFALTGEELEVKINETCGYCDGIIEFNSDCEHSEYGAVCLNCFIGLND